MGGKPFMSSFTANLNGMKKVVDDENSLVKELKNCGSSISGVKGSVNLGASTQYIRKRIARASDAVIVQSTKMNDMRSKLESINSDYESTENRIIDRQVKTYQSTDASGNFISNILSATYIPLLISPICPSPSIGLISFLNWIWSKDSDDSDSESSSKVKETYSKISAGGIADIIMGEADKNSSIYKDASKIKDYNKKIKEFNDNNKIYKTEEKGYIDENGEYHRSTGDSKEAKENEKVRKEIDSLKEEATIYKKSVGDSVSYDSDKVEGSYGIASGSLNYDIGKAEWNASASAGLYSYDKNGNKILTPGLQATVGVGVTAITTTAKGQIGNEYFNAHGSVTATVGKAEAKGSVNVGLLDENGNFNPRAKVSAKAEAIAAEISGKAGVTVAGTDVGVTGSLNVGIGAHADVGYSDGKFSLDIGASVGIGASVKLDIDMSGTINAVSKVAKAIWRW
jgi:hypothetical protein